MHTEIPRPTPVTPPSTTPPTHPRPLDAAPPPAPPSDDASLHDAWAGIVEYASWLRHLA